jgi:hypothetical protein
MSRGTIIEESTETPGTYLVEIQYERAQLDQKIQTAEVKIIELTTARPGIYSQWQSAVTRQGDAWVQFQSTGSVEDRRAWEQAKREVDALQSRLDANKASEVSYRKALAYYQSRHPENPQEWLISIDGTTGLTGEIGIWEVPNADGGWNRYIKPGLAAYEKTTDGALVQALSKSPLQSIRDAMARPRGDKGFPIFRTGVVESVDEGAQTAVVTLDAAKWRNPIPSAFTLPREIDLNINSGEIDVGWDELSADGWVVQADDEVVVQLPKAWEGGQIRGWKGGKVLANLFYTWVRNAIEQYEIYYGATYLGLVPQENFDIYWEGEPIVWRNASRSRLGEYDHRITMSEDSSFILYFIIKYSRDSYEIIKQELITPGGGWRVNSTETAYILPDSTLINIALMGRTDSQFSARYNALTVPTASPFPSGYSGLLPRTPYGEGGDYTYTFGDFSARYTDFYDSTDLDQQHVGRQVFITLRSGLSLYGAPTQTSSLYLIKNGNVVQAFSNTIFASYGPYAYLSPFSITFTVSMQGYYAAILIPVIVDKQQKVWKMTNTAITDFKDGSVIYHV